MQKRIRRLTAEESALNETLKMLNRYKREGKVVAFVGAVLLDTGLDSPEVFFHSMSSAGRRTQTVGMAYRVLGEAGWGHEFQTKGIRDPKVVERESRKIRREAARARCRIIVE